MYSVDHKRLSEVYIKTLVLTSSYVLWKHFEEPLFPISIHSDRLVVILIKSEYSRSTCTPTTQTNYHGQFILHKQSPFSKVRKLYHTYTHTERHKAVRQVYIILYLKVLVEILWLVFYQAILYFSINSNQSDRSSNISGNPLEKQYTVVPQNYKKNTKTFSLKLMQFVFFLLWTIFKKNTVLQKRLLQNESVFVVPCNMMACNHLTALYEGVSTWRFWGFFYWYGKFREGNSHIAYFTLRSIDWQLTYAAFY